MSRYRFLGALLLASSATLGACTIVDDSDATGSAFSDPTTQSCLRTTIEECFAQAYSAEVCAALIEQRCLGDMPDPGDPGDPGDPNDPGTPGDPDCVIRVYEDCVAAGVDEMVCREIASDQCNSDPGGPGDPPPPPCEDPPPPPPGPDPACIDQVFRDCLAQGVDPMTCEAYAWQVCDPTNGGGDPNDPMNPPPDPRPDPNDPMQP